MSNGVEWRKYPNIHGLPRINISKTKQEFCKEIENWFKNNNKDFCKYGLRISKEYSNDHDDGTWTIYKRTNDFHEIVAYSDRPKVYNETDNGLKPLSMDHGWYLSIEELIEFNWDIILCYYENLLNERHYINCPYEEKEEAKALGAQWDKDKKSWYYIGNQSNKFEKWNKSKNNVLEKEKHSTSSFPFTIYTFDQQCYKCKSKTSIYTYIKFVDNDEDLSYPWDFERLLKGQYLLNHLKDSSIEYYGLSVIGENDYYDELLAKKFPNKIKKKYSNIQKREYYMNLCDNCGAIQGWNYIYRKINILIQQKAHISFFS